VLLDDCKVSTTVKPFNSSGRQRRDLLNVRALLRSGATSLVICSTFHPLSILKEAVHLLLPSCPLVIHCEFQEPLVECYLYLQQTGYAIKMQIADTWCREYQTLPNRSHPMMNMSTSGGYLLWGTFVGTGKIVSGRVVVGTEESETSEAIQVTSSSSNFEEAEENLSQSNKLSRVR
jgi:hypothetical protein